MDEYIILTDSGCDIRTDLLDEWNVKQIDLSFSNKDEPQKSLNGNIEIGKFYDMMRNGTVFQTSAINADTFTEMFTREAEAGHNILYLAFSSGLSSTSSTAAIVAKDICEKYPGVKITVIDTLCASAGHGLLLYFAVEKKKSGASMDETAEYVRGLIPKLAHWFTVDNLVYLKRGGRVSAAAAFAATALGIKPVLHVDDEGHLINVKKVHGRRLAIKELASQYENLAEDPENGIYFISHGDCMEDAEQLETILNEKFGHKAKLITDIGPVIGSHSGPGTLALFFLAKSR